MHSRCNCHQEGALGRFSFEALMVTVAVGLAMVHTAHIIGDFIAKGVLPQRKAYKEATEEDFGDFRSTGWVDWTLTQRSQILHHRPSTLDPRP